MRALLAAALTAALTGAASAAPLFSDNFNAQNGGVGTLNFSGFTNWTVSNGSVDLIGNGFFDFYPGDPEDDEVDQDSPASLNRR